MNFWYQIRRSWRKSLDLKRISNVLGGDIPLTVNELFEAANRKQLAEEQLYDLVEQDQYLRAIMTTHGATRDTLKTIYNILLKSGAGQWVRGHWVAASALAFGASLEFLLTATDSTEKVGGRDAWNAVAFELVEYFEKGKTGPVSA